MPEFDVRLYENDGTLSIIMKTNSRNIADVRVQTWAMIRGPITFAEIWLETKYVETIRPSRTS
jgi:hypothetical protein